MNILPSLGDADGHIEKRQQKQLQSIVRYLAKSEIALTIPEFLRLVETLFDRDPV